MWQPVIQLLEFAVAIITIVGIAVKVTRHITQIESKITIEATKLDGRINQLEDRIKTATHELDIQRKEITKLKDYLAANAQAWILALWKGQK